MTALQHLSPGQPMLLGNVEHAGIRYRHGTQTLIADFNVTTIAVAP
jgi:hypothetical protein